MSSEDNNITIKSISKSLDTDIKFLTLALTMGKNKKNPSILEEKTIVVLLGNEKLFILFEDFREVKLEFDYNAITKIYLDFDNIYSLLICLDKSKLTSKRKLDAFHLFVKNRSMFIKSLICYHSIHNMELNGTVEELCIKKKKFFMENREESLLTKGLDMIHNNPDNFIKVFKNGAEFFLKDCIKEEKDNYYKMFTTKGEKEFLSYLIIEFSETILVEKFQVNKDDKDLYYYGYNNFLNYMRLYEKNTKFWITKYEFYNKKFNLNIDKSRWEGFKIEIRTATYENPIEKKREGSNENMVFLFLRRKFIPPFYDSYIDIMIVLKEPYEEDNFDFSYDAELIVETIADSIHFPQKTLTPNEYENILEAKIEALLLDEDTLDYYYSNLKIFGKECYKSACDYIYHLLTLYEKQNQEKVDVVKELLTDKIVSFNTTLDPSFDFSEYDKKYIRSNDIDTIIRDFEMKINIMNSNEYYNQVKSIWEVKLWRYLVFCVDGGICGDLLNLEKIISIYKKTMGLNPSIIYHTQIQVNNMLNIRIFNHKDQPMESKISTIINQVNEVKTFYYNERILNAMIKTGVLKSIQGIENDSSYANFLKYLLDNDPTVEFLKSLFHFLRDISVDFDVSSAEQALRKSLNSILSSLMAIYSNTKLCPITLILACKCLTILTCSDIDKNNKTKILQDDVIEHISNFLECQDEKLLFCSLKLLLNILPELQESIGEILYKNSKLIPRLIGVLAGTGVPKTFHSVKTIQSVVIVLMNLLRMQVTVVREKLCGERHRMFIGYLLRYINEEDSIGEKVSNLLVPLQKYIFEFLVDIIKKNSDTKKYMQETYGIVAILQDQAFKNLSFLRDLVKDPEKAQKMYGDLIDPTLKKLEMMLKFAFFFITGDKELIALIKTENEQRKNYFVDFINIGFDNKTKELVSKLAIPVCSIHNELNYIEEEDF